MAPVASFDTVTPGTDTGVFQPPKPPSNFSIRSNATPMYIRVTSKGPLVKGVYGDGKKQEELRGEYKQQVDAGDVTDRLIMYGYPLCQEQADKLREWEAEWADAAADHAKSTTSTKKGFKLQYSPLLRDDDSFKFNVPFDVIDLCKREADVDGVFDLGHAHYDLVFKVSGMWRNNSNYGLSLSALRMRRGALISSTLKRKAPEDFEFGESKWQVAEEE